MLTLRIFKTLIAKEQSCEDARLRVGSLIELCAIVTGAEKVLNLCNIHDVMQDREGIVFERTRDTDQRIHEPCVCL